MAPRLAFVLQLLAMLVAAILRPTTAQAAQPSNPPAGSAHWQAPLTTAAPWVYLMQISLGTPAQSFLAIADTTSDLTWLDCPPCKACGFADSCTDCRVGFFSNYSSTYVPLPCSSTFCQLVDQTGSGSTCSAYSSDTLKGCYYVYRYGDGSQSTQTSGNIAQETITMQAVQGGNQTVTDFWFGCSTAVSTDVIKVQAGQGVVGLGRGQVSLPSQLGTYFGHKFGYCLVNRPVTKSIDAVYSSPLFFGSEAVPVTSADGPQLQYTPMIVNSFYPSLYYVGWKGISLNGTNISNVSENAFDIANNGSGGIFFDSSSTFTTLRSDIFKSLTSAIRQQITKYNVSENQVMNDGLCYTANWDDWVNDYGKEVPVISFQFSNTSGFNLSADTAWYLETSLELVCLAIYSSFTFSGSRFGNHQQVGYQILYDLESSQIGFVPATCPATQFQGLPPDVQNGGTSLFITGLFSMLSSLLILLVLAQ